MDPNPYASLANNPEPARAFGKRFGCLAFMLLIAVAGALLLYCTRYMSKERGLRLENFQAGNFTFNAWSYGNWKTSHDGTLTIETYEPPYMLLLAISPADSRAATIEILQADLVDPDGDRKSVVATIADRVEEVVIRPTAAVRQPYAVFHFDDLLQSHETITLEVEFRVTREASVETVTQRLIISGFEKVRRSFTFVEVLMGI